MIPPRRHKDYIEYHQQVSTDAKTCEQAMAESDVLFQSTTSLEEKKRILFLLGHAVTMDAYGLLNRYLANPDHELADWAKLAAQECAMFMKSDVFQEDRTEIMGQNGNRLPCYFVVSTKRSVSLTGGAAKTYCRDL